MYICRWLGYRDNDDDDGDYEDSDMDDIDSTHSVVSE